MVFDIKERIPLSCVWSVRRVGPFWCPLSSSSAISPSLGAYYAHLSGRATVGPENRAEARGSRPKSGTGGRRS